MDRKPVFLGSPFSLTSAKARRRRGVCLNEPKAAPVSSVGAKETARTGKRRGQESSEDRRNSGDWGSGGA